MTNCEFKQIAENEYECKRCGFKIKIRQDPTKIHRACPKMSTMEKVESFVSTMADFVTSGFKTSEEDKAGNRLEICKGCDHFDGTSCKLCGCVMTWKSKIEAAHCPIDRW